MSNSFSLTPKQEQAQSVLGGEAKHVMLFGGSRSGKTFLIVRGIVVRALAAEKSRHAILRFRFNHCKQSVVYDTFPKVMELCFPECPHHLDKSDWFVELPNQSQIWFGGLDDKERTEKVLGNEYASIFLNEASQASYNGYLILLTRLAQRCTYERDGEDQELRLKFFADENPPSKTHWSHELFVDKRDPTTKLGLPDPENYDSLQMNPADNQENLPGSYIESLKNLPKRKRDRFFLGLFGDDAENALWTAEILERSRVTGEELPDMVRVVVAVDPSGASEEDNEANDEIGIGVVGLGTDGVGYVMEDLTVKAGPATWGQVVASAYDRHLADRVVGEANFGGAMVEYVIKTANPAISYVSVTASRGKVVRAEPISALHETGKIRLVGKFPQLEDELTAFTTTGYIGTGSPNRADWFVWAFTELFGKITHLQKLRQQTGQRPKHANSKYQPHRLLAR